MGAPLHRLYWSLILVAALLVLGIPGCGGSVPQFATPEQQKLLKRFESQVAQKKAGPFEQLAKQVDEMHQKGRLTDDQRRLLSRVCEHAKAGEWADADALIKPVVAGQGKQ
jgi:hypothetical protein